MKKHFNFKSVYRAALVALCQLTVGVGNAWADTWLYGSFQSWVAKDNDYKFTYDGSVGNYYLELEANTEYEFKIIDGDNYYSMNNANYTTTTEDQLIYTGNNNCKVTTGEAGIYVFKTWWADNNRHFSIYFPQARLEKQKYIYFDVRNQTNWNSADFDARFWFKYYDSGSDNGSVDCNKGNALENWVYYALVPDNDYIGQIQMNRLNPSDHDHAWCTANIAYAKDRTSSAQNCLKEESGKADYCIYWTPQWTTYCPPMSSVTLADNGTTNWGGNGSSGNPFLVPTGGDIKVHVTASASALNDANMTKYFLFKKEGSAVGEGSSSTEKTITASGTTGTKEAVTVDAYNYYNSTEGTHLTSSAIYYEARTPYTISYNKGTYGTGSRDSETKLKGVNFTLPNSAVFTRTGYTQTSWSTADGSGTNYSLGGSYTTDAAQAFYPAWTANEYTVTLNNLEATTAGTESVTATYDATLSAITKPTKIHYDFGGYWTSSNGGSTLTTQLIDENGNWKKSISGYTGASGDDPTWVYADDITLYAKWTEHEYAITIAVTGSGSTSPASSTTAKYVTASGDISATPASGYSFRDWDFSKTGEDNDVYSADGYSSVSNPIHILAQHDGTLTANFTANGYTVTLEDLGADEGHKGTSSVSVTYDATTNLTSSITCPQKAHYDFGGYWTSSNGGSTLTTQLIDDNGAWIEGVSGYTSASKQWIYAGDITLYAKWTETAYTITPSVSPAGAGSVNTVTDAHLVAPSSEITATPTKAVWVFDYWTCGTNVGIAGGKTTTDNPVTVTASQNSTITANFKHRYNLLGSKYEEGKGKAEMATGGMPGWTYGSGADFTINSYTADGDNATVDLSYTCTLDAGTYIFEIHDRQKGESLGRKGDGGGVYALTDGSSVQLKGGTDKDQSIFFYPQHAGRYTFRITYMTKDGNYYYPTVTIERPHQLHFGTGYAGIDNLSSVTSGTTGGTLAVTTSAGSLSNEDWVTYGTDVTYTPSAATGYTFEGFYSSNEYSDRFTQNNPWIHYNVTGDDNVYAKFEEKSTSVTLANDGHGKVQIGGVDKTSTTCGVTTTRELTAVPNEGYKFSSWSKSGDDITLSSTSTNPTTLSGNGSGATSGQTVTANFVERYSIKGTMNGENWGTTHTLSNIGTNAGSKDTCYVTMTLPANTTYEFAIYDEQTGGWYKASTVAVYNMTYTNHTNWEFGDTKTYNCGITTAGKGTYKFIFNITDKTVTVVYPTSYQVNYGASVGGSVTSVVDGDGKAVPNGGYVVAGGSVAYTAAAASGYTFVGWCNNDSYGDTFTNINPWTNSGVAAASNAYAKFKSTNFVIYRSGDMSSDPRAAYDDVESYAGGTISEAIEFRMRVNRLDKWYTLCLPFTVNAVKVWDEEDGQYYDIVPYWRTDGTYYTGHYIIRTPVSTTDFAIENFDSRDRWVDPSNAGYLPSANTPYIIQWHDSWFQDKYISFFGPTGESIPTSMNQGANTSSDETVNIYGNNCMTSGTVRDAYMLDSDYGSGGAWLRAEVGTDRTVLPFECFILANATTTAKYRVLRRDMADTPTGWDTVSETENKTTKVLIDNNIYIIREGRIYTIQGTLVKEGK